MSDLILTDTVGVCCQGVAKETKTTLSVFFKGIYIK